MVWCYGCDAEVGLLPDRALHEARALVRRYAGLGDHVMDPSATNSDVQLPAVNAAPPALKGKRNSGHARSAPGKISWWDGGVECGATKAKPKAKPRRNTAGKRGRLKGVAPGMCGIPNIGNTCFFNSVLQTLAQMPPLVAGLVITPRPAGIAGLLSDVLRTMWKPSSGSPNPRKLFGAICGLAPQFRGFGQQDAHELLRVLVDGLRDESDVRPPLVDTVWRGEMVSVVICDVCAVPSLRREPLYDISLPVGKPRAAATRPHSGYVAGAGYGAASSSRRGKRKNKRKNKRRGQGLAVDDWYNPLESAIPDRAAATEQAAVPGHDALSGELSGFRDGTGPDIDHYVGPGVAGSVSFHRLPPELAAAASATPITLEGCLAAFAAVETLDAANRYACSACTKAKLGSIEAERGEPLPQQVWRKRRVFQTALKQLVLTRLPPVLILHLKRFDQSRGRMAKLGAHVVFPPILDMAPFVASDLPHVDAVELAHSSSSDSSASNDDDDATAHDDAPLTYALVGIVVHSGSLHGGHYVAYVRHSDAIATAQRRSDSNAADPSVDSEPRTRSQWLAWLHASAWLYVSDSSVSLSSLDDVLRQQAYLLVYERIECAPEPVPGPNAQPSDASETSDVPDASSPAPVT
ncbi:ubiquitin carboxyl-terminal hydrolase 16 [Thecamonas trahens ATCC 50062]|uniref:Ubiquitin carboxyl-terminal hydrolase n=1 Tax=Thecamonas trahens ATCC 50062 TaxID=461836 RepID=A0A0L0DUJ1_THETB|nr:ubiquitin carboxyl-terminal hydrolase 16 [Thecamonas trahens ATCC 50062]KNC56004.1 ubiquitin carboxyl-terminal hydrolase 16 [Thecamonas trahens ATCC 50062]|eukprot:XP_013761050.1 ubiquitin carboxyl-terminal hydrolase 16 [Thecamonas trahens ATCC 50062]